MRRTATTILMVLSGGCVSSDSPMTADGPMGVFMPDASSSEPTGGSTGGSTTASTSSTTGFVPVTTGSSGTSGTTGFVPVTTGSGGTTTGTTGAGGSTTGSSGGAGSTMGGATGGTTGGSTGEDTGGTTTPSNPDDEFDEVRQVCVDTINMYRATLDLAPLERAAPSLEMCSDSGAKQDADNNAPHSSSGSCSGLGAQNTCPGWPVGGFSGSATLADALKGCLAAMWAEDEPPEGREKCIQDYFAGDTQCFLAHGHYLNMSDANAGQVACGIYDMGDNKYWMNQDFGR